MLCFVIMVNNPYSDCTGGMVTLVSQRSSLQEKGNLLCLKILIPFTCKKEFDKLDRYHLQSNLRFAKGFTYTILFDIYKTSVR